MATLQAATTSTGAIVSDPQAVRELCESYCFGTLDWEVTEDGELTIWGYDDFEAYEARENGLPLATGQPRWNRPSTGCAGRGAVSDELDPRSSTASGSSPEACQWTPALSARGGWRVIAVRVQRP
jgi:hypothetical protein